MTPSTVSCENDGAFTHIELRFNFNVRTGSIHEALDGRSIMDVPLGELLNILSRIAKEENHD
jgi:hypothetical protein